MIRVALAVLLALALVGATLPAVDTDGDGAAERVGRNKAISFDVRTGVVVVVPPGGRGVGDGANADERSPGWGRQ